MWYIICCFVCLKKNISEYKHLVLFHTNISHAVMGFKAVSSQFFPSPHYEFSLRLHSSLGYLSISFRPAFYSLRQYTEFNVCDSNFRYLSRQSDSIMHATVYIGYPRPFLLKYLLLMSFSQYISRNVDKVCFCYFFVLYYNENIPKVDLQYRSSNDRSLILEQI